MPAVPRKTFDAVHGVAEAQLCNRALSRIGAELIADTEEQTKQARICRELYIGTRNEVLRTALFNFAIKILHIPYDENREIGFDGFEYAFKANLMIPFTGTNDTSTNITAMSIDTDESMVGLGVTGDEVPEGARILSVGTNSVVLDRATTGVAANLVIQAPVLKIISIMDDPAKQFLAIGPFNNRTILTKEYTDIGDDGNPYLVMKYVHEVVNPDEFDTLFTEALVLRLAAKMAHTMTTTPQIASMLNNEYIGILRQAEKSSSEERQVDEADEWWTDRKGV